MSDRASRVTGFWHAKAHGCPISANDYTGNRNRAKLKDIEAADITTVILRMQWFDLP
jgi:hypothetical protein